MSTGKPQTVPPPTPEAFARVAELIADAHYPVALTGAGVSTASGIPDFRSVYCGLWGKHDPMQVASLAAFRQDPSIFYEWVRPLLGKIETGEPNAAHLALARLEELDNLQAVITQNIDGLHRKAGSQTIHALHGHTQTATCTHCFKKYDAQPILEHFLQSGDIPYCRHCNNAVLKPDVILFGEQLPFQVMQAARQAIQKADLLLIVGTSLRVAPAADYPRLAYEYGARLVVANDERTYADRYAEVVLRGDVTDTIPEIVRVLETR